MANHIWRSKEHAVLNSKPAPAVFVDEAYPAIIRRFLTARGLGEAQIAKDLFSTKLSDLKDPFLMKGMDIAVQRLVQAFKNNEKVAVYADFDLDGTSGLALLREGLMKLGYKNLSYAQPRRLSDGYGFHAHIVEELAKSGVSLIVTVDVGITAFAAATKAKECGVDVIITDHHQPAETLPDALVVVNPNQRACTSKLGYLCGAGVAFYLLRALKRVLVDEGLVSENQFDLKSVLDFFCIATLTDMVPLVEDNRALVKHGLVAIEKTTHPGLRSLLESLGLTGRPLSSSDVAIRFAPKLNALSRMENGILPIDIMIEEDITVARSKVEQILENNSTRVQLQSSGEQEALESLKNWPHENFVVVASEQFHRGVIGLIATKIAGQKNVPSFVGSISKEGSIVGSARRAPGSSMSLLRALDAASEVLMRFGGHDAAAGFELKTENLKKFEELLADYYSKADLGNAEVVSEYDLDAGLTDINESLMKWFDALGPFGQGFQNPLLCFKNVTLKDFHLLKGGHLKLKVEDETSGRRMDALYFSPPPNISPDDLKKGTKINLLAEMQWNYFAGNKSVQLLVKDVGINT